MNRRTRIAVFLGTSLVIAACPAGAVLVQRAFVSGGGSNANPCSLTLPCRNFDIAIATTAAGGEVIALDSAGYGAFSIAQGVSVIAPPGVYAGISVFSGNGVTVNAGTAVVTLRGLTINAQGSTQSGIADFAASELHVEHCQVAGFNASVSSAGIAVFTSADPAQVFVLDSVLSDNYFGVGVAAIGSTPLLRIESTRMTGNNVGLGVYTPSRISVHASSMSTQKTLGYGGAYIAPTAAGPFELHFDDSVIDGAYTGIDASKGSATYVSVSLVRMQITHASFGLSLTGGANAGLADSRFTHDDTAVVINAGSTLYSAGNTYMAFNSAYVTGPGTYTKPAGGDY